MRSNAKRLFSLLLAAVLVFSLSLAAFAADGESLRYGGRGCNRSRRCCRR